MSSKPPRQCSPHKGQSGRSAPGWIWQAGGLLALLWFLIRVFPRPSRVTYPCQRVAAPLAGGFLVWLIGTLTSVFAYRQGLRLWQQSKARQALVFLLVAAAVGLGTLATISERPARAEPPVPNDPIGEARGVHPGRVVWVHDPAATDWEGPGHGHWWEAEHTSQIVVSQMMSAALRELSGETQDAAAWDRLIRYFNLTHGHGDVGYTAGEKIVIKTNFVGCLYPWGGTDPETLTWSPAETT